MSLNDFTASIAMTLAQVRLVLFPLKKGMTLFRCNPFKILYSSVNFGHPI